MNFEADAWSRYWSWSFVYISKLNFAQEIEAEFWTRFLGWSLVDILKLNLDRDWRRNLLYDLKSGETTQTSGRLCPWQCFLFLSSQQLSYTRRRGMEESRKMRGQTGLSQVSEGSQLFVPELSDAAAAERAEHPLKRRQRKDLQRTTRLVTNDKVTIWLVINPKCRLALSFALTSRKGAQRLWFLVSHTWVLKTRPIKKRTNKSVLANLSKIGRQFQKCRS